MARRLAAALGIIAVVGLLLMLLWSVYRHREGTLADEPAMVAMRAERA